MQTPLTPGTWIAAVAPVVALFALVVSGRVAARTAAWLVAALAAVLGAAVFGAGPKMLAVAAGKGLWLGFWILAVIWPAMLLYQLADRAGLGRIGRIAQDLFPNPREKLLLLAWLLPSFVQGVAGFGTPIAVAAPLLVAAGWGPGRAVVYALIGYHWSVTFGSMGSPFYIGTLTSELDPGATEMFARYAAFLLGVNALLAGAVLLVLEGGLRGLAGGARLLLLAGVPAAAALFFVAPVVPALGSVAAAVVGLCVAFGTVAVDRLRSRPVGARVQAGGRAVWVIAPYGYLVSVALAVMLVPASRRWVGSHAVVGPAFPATTTGRGVRNAAVSPYTPLEIFGHPGMYLLLACLLGYFTYRLAGLWPRTGARRLAREWLGSVRDTSISVLALACVATVLRDAGMTATLARGLVTVAGDAYPYLAALTGAVGSFLTGSSTAANALFAALQASVAGLINVPAPVLLAAQTAGANVGNAVAPVIVLVGLGAVGAQRELAWVIRAVALVVLVLLGVVTGMTMLLLAVGPFGL